MNKWPHSECSSVIELAYKHVGFLERLESLLEDFFTVQLGLLLASEGSITQKRTINACARLLITPGFEVYGYETLRAMSGVHLSEDFEALFPNRRSLGKANEILMNDKIQLAQKSAG